MYARKYLTSQLRNAREFSYEMKLEVAGELIDEVFGRPVRLTLRKRLATSIMAYWDSAAFFRCLEGETLRELGIRFLCERISPCGGCRGF